MDIQQYNKGGVKDGEIVCHGDFGVWNIVWQNEEAVDIVDWDMAFPAKPRYDFCMLWNTQLLSVMMKHLLIGIPSQEYQIENRHLFV